MHSITASVQVHLRQFSLDIYLCFNFACLLFVPLGWMYGWKALRPELYSFNYVNTDGRGMRYVSNSPFVCLQYTDQFSYLYNA